MSRSHPVACRACSAAYRAPFASCRASSVACQSSSVLGQAHSVASRVHSVTCRASSVAYEGSSVLGQSRPGESRSPSVTGRARSVACQTPCVGSPTRRPVALTRSTTTPQQRAARPGQVAALVNTGACVQLRARPPPPLAPLSIPRHFARKKGREESWPRSQNASRTLRGWLTI